MGECDVAEWCGYFSARVHGLNIVDSLGGTVFCDFVCSDDGCVTVFCNGEGIFAEVIGVAVGYCDVGAVDIFRGVLSQWVSGEEGVDCNCIFRIFLFGNEEAGVSEIGDIDGHGFILSLSAEDQMVGIFSCCIV